MDGAGKESWRRDLLRAALLTAAMLGSPVGMWAAVKYYRHVDLGYYGWRWAKADGLDNCWRSRLVNAKASRSARAFGWSVAYRESADKDKKTLAAYAMVRLVGLRELYDLVVQEKGVHSRAADVLQSWLELSCLDLEQLAFPRGAAAEGITNFHVDERPPGEEGETVWYETSYACRKLEVRFDLGSYHVEGYGHWRLTVSERWERERYDLGVVKRLAGPWRELAPP